MPKKTKVAPGRKRLDKPKLKGMPLFCFQALQLQDKYLTRIRNNFDLWVIYDEFQQELWKLCLNANAPEWDKRMFYTARLQAMLEDITSP